MVFCQLFDAADALEVSADMDGSKMKCNIHLFSQWFQLRIHRAFYVRILKSALSWRLQWGEI